MINFLMSRVMMSRETVLGRDYLGAMLAGDGFGVLGFGRTSGR